MILSDKSKFTALGAITKPHGLKGEVVIETEDELTDLFFELEHILVDIEGGVVPFFISEDGVRSRNSSSLLVKFDGINSAEEAKKICGCQLFTELELDDEEDDETVTMEQFNGYAVRDVQRGDLGKVISIENFSGNMVMTIKHPKAEIMIPVSDDIILEIDDEKKLLLVDCPEGLIDLYLE